MYQLSWYLVTLKRSVVFFALLGIIPRKKEGLTKVSFKKYALQKQPDLLQASLLRVYQIQGIRSQT